MKTLKRLALGMVLVAGLGMAFASCSDNYTDMPGEPSNPIHNIPSNPVEGIPEQPPVVDPR